MNKKKVLGIVLVVFILLFGGVAIIVKSKVNSEEIRAIVLQKLQETFPQAQVNLGKFDLSLGKSVTLEAADLEVIYKKDFPLIKVQDAQIQIPIWAILFNSGSIDLVTNSPTIGYYSIGQSSNWELAMKEKSKKTPAPKKKEQNSETSEKSEVKIPSFLSSSSINISLFKMLVIYELEKNSKGEIQVDKFLLKNLGLDSTAGFEISTSMSSTLSKKESIAFNILSVGQFKLKDILEKKMIETTMTNQISKFNLKGMPYHIPDIKNEIKLKAHFDGALEAATKIFFEKSTLRFLLVKNQTNMNIRELDGKILVSDLISILNNPELKIDSEKSELSLIGDISIKDEKVYPDLALKLAPSVRISAFNQDFLVSLSGDLKDESGSIASEMKAFDGVINSRLDYEIKQQPFSLRGYDAQVSVNNIKIKKSWLDQFSQPQGSTDKPSADTRPTTGETSKQDQAKAQAQEKVELPTGITKLQVINSKIEGLTLSGTSQIETKGNQLIVKPSIFSLGDGDIRLSSQTTLKPSSQKTTFDVGLKDLNIEVFNSFLPKKIEGSKGVFNGSISGVLQSEGEKSFYDVSMNIKGKDGSLEGINIKDYTEKIEKIVQKLPLLKDKFKAKKEVDLSDAFDHLVLNGNFKNDHFKISKFLFDGIKGKVLFELEGNLYPQPESKKESTLEGYFIDEFGLSEVLQKNVGDKKLPVKLSGKGFSLSPEYDYTLKRMAKTAYQEKAKEKVKKEIDRNVDKIKEKGKKEVKKLLKGIFR